MKATTVNKTALKFLIVKGRAYQAGGLAVVGLGV